MDQKWYQDFTAEENMPRAMLFEVVTAANYMTIKPLLALCCLKVTFQLTNKSAEEVSKNMNGCMDLSCLFYPSQRSYFFH
jgi:S-phase kinase-associated protein 1